MSVKINILQVVKTVEIDGLSYTILNLICGLDGRRPRTVSETSQETGRSLSLVYSRIAKMRKLGLIDSERRPAKLEILQNA